MMDFDEDMAWLLHVVDLVSFLLLEMMATYKNSLLVSKSHSLWKANKHF